MSLRIAKSRFKLPDEAVTQTFAILAKRGAGKSYTASVMVEEMLENGLLPVVIDPLGVWWGLQSSADGKSEGYPITVLGGDHGDVPLEPTAGATIADFIVEHAQPVVIDLSHFSKADQIRFVTQFAERLFQKNRDPLHLIVDEADLFAPQGRTQGFEVRCLGAMEDLARRGRAKGIGMTFVTQRSAVLNKNVLTQIEVLVVLRTTSPQDRKAIKAWVDVHGEEEVWREMDRALPKLPIGTAYIWSPGWLDTFAQVEVRERRTFDSSATPKVGEKRVEPKKRAEPDLEALSEQIAETIERAKQDDPVELRKQIAELKSQAPVPAEPEEVEVQVEVEVFPSELADALRNDLGAAKQQLNETTSEISKALDEAFAAINRAAAASPKEPRSPGRAGVTSRPELKSEDKNPPRRPAARPPGTSGTLPSTDEEVHLKAGARRMLEMLARHYPLTVTKAQLAALAGMAPKGGTFNTYYGQIRRCGFMVEQGVGKNPELLLTEEGFAYLGTEVPRTPLTTEERLDMWRGTLKEGARAMLNVLVEAHLRGETVSKEDLAQEAGLRTKRGEPMAVSGGTFNTYLGILRRNGLAEQIGAEVRAGEALFVGT